MAVPLASRSGTRFGRGTMGKGEERGVDLGKLRADREARVGQMGMEALDRVVVAIAAGEADEVDVRVAREQADQLAADVARSADDPDADPSGSVVGRAAALRAGEDPRRPVRRDRRGRLESCAHGRTKPLTGG